MAFNKYEQQNRAMAGCYALLQSDNSPLQLPLKNFNYYIEIVDSFAQVTLTQTYFNPNQHALDVQYIFPVHPNGIVNRLQVEFGGQKNTGLVMQKQEAKKQFEYHMSEGAGAAYGEYNPQNRDIMKMVVGNIAAKQEVKVILTYIHANYLVNNTFYQYRLTSTMTPRYARGLQLPQLLFNSFGNSKTMEGKCSWSVNVTIRSSRNITKVQSNTHKLKKLINNNETSYTFAEQNVLPDRDFSLYYTLQNHTKPLYSISHSDNNTTAAISFIPKYCPLSIDDAYKQHLKGKSFQVDLDATRGEYIFLLDRSGSMEGIRIDNAKRALEVFLRSLPEDSFFNVLSFGSSFKYLFQASAKNTKENVEQAAQKISQMEADLGGTQILGAIKSLVKIQVIQGYPRQLFFLTDGAVSNVNDVLKYISKHTQYTRVNSIGIGNGLSQHLIRGSAEKGKGYSIFIEDNQRPQKKIISMLQNTLSPVISNIQFECDRTKVESIVPNPDKIPYILKNDIATFYITFNGKMLQPFETNIKYKDTLGNTYSQKIIINPNAENVNCKWLHHFVNSQKIQALSDSYDFGQNKQDRIYYVKQLNKQKLKQQIISQSIKHQILTQHTAFLCIDANAVDNIKKQNLNSPKIKVNIKGMNPYDHVVNFINEADEDDQQGEYINECGIMEYELPPQQLKKIVKFQQMVKTYRAPLKLGMRQAGKPQPRYFPGDVPLPQPQKRQAINYIIKKQDSNGAWKQDFLDSLFVDANQLREAFKRTTDMTSIITFLVCQYFSRFLYKQEQYSMIVKKGKNYIDKNSRMKYGEMQNIFHKFYSRLSV